jgi:hypothetical protein
MPFPPAKEEEQNCKPKDEPNHVRLAIPVGQIGHRVFPEEDGSTRATLLITP